MTYRKNRGMHFFYSVAICLSLTATVFAQTTTSASDEQIELLKAQIKEKLEKFRVENGIPGVTAAFVLEDGREGAVAAGFSDVENNIPMDIGDKLLSGSIGKTYFAAVAMQLVSENKLDLDTKISNWLGNEKWFSRLPNGADITVRMLMNHTSGIPEHVQLQEFGQAVGDDPDRVWKPEELLEYIFNAEPLFEAGKGWSYADTNYIVLGIILEKIIGGSLYEELKERILIPLGLKDTVPSDSRTIPGLIPGYAGTFTPFKKAGKTIIDGKFVINPQLEWTGGGLASTTMDLARWGALVYQGKAFSQELMTQVLDGHSASILPGDRYGLGVIIWDSKYGKCLGHSGWFPGYMSQLTYFTGHKLSLALQMNTDTVRGAGTKMRAILEDFVEILSK